MTDAAPAPKNLRVRTIAPHRDTSSSEGRIDRQVGDVYEIDEARARERVMLGMVALVPEDPQAAPLETTDAPPTSPDITPGPDAGADVVTEATEAVATSEATPPTEEQPPLPEAPPEES